MKKNYDSQIVRSHEKFEFELYGETFTAIAECPGSILMDFIDGISLANDTEVPAHKRPGGFDSSYAFLKSVIEPESWDRFEPMLRDITRPIPLNILSEIVNDISSFYSKRPTSRQ